MEATNYFSHDSNARNDERVLLLRIRHGAAGYGIYFMLLERLRDASGYMSMLDYDMLAFDLREDAELIRSVVEDFGLFTITECGGYFYSQSFLNRMEMKNAKQSRLSEAGKAGAKERWGKKEGSKPQSRKPATQVPKPGAEGQGQPAGTAAPPVPIQARDEKPAAGKDTENGANLARFFDKNNQSDIQQLLISLGMKPAEEQLLRTLADEVVNEWRMADKRHNGYTDWAQHLIATLRIKKAASGKKKALAPGTPGSRPKAPPEAPPDYTFAGGFGGQDT